MTQLLLAYRDGDRSALDRLLPIVYADLRRIAHVHVIRRPNGYSLDTTSLIHEAYLRLVDGASAGEDRGHFLSVCARAMRQIVISRVRRKATAKRGGEAEIIPWADDLPAGVRPAEWYLDLDRALDRLGSLDERLVRVVECRFFAGLTEEETAEAMGSSVRTVQREWARARGWLRAQLSEVDS